MAVAVNTISTPMLFKALEIGELDVNWLSTAGITVTVQPSQIMFSASHGVVGTVPVKLTHLLQLKQGKLTGLAKTSLQLLVKAKIAQLKKVSAGSGKTSDPPSVHSLDTAVTEPFTMQSGTALGMLKKTQEKASNESAPAAAETVGAFPAKYFPGTTPTSVDKVKLSLAPLVQLRNAEMMYQPVRGTSNDTRYFMVGAAMGLRVAARYKGSSLSVRIEGTKFALLKPKIEACGFTNLNAEYASMHLQVPDPVIAAKTLGAILLGLGVTLLTPMPNLQLIKDIAS